MVYRNVDYNISVRRKCVLHALYGYGQYYRQMSGPSLRPPPMYWSAFVEGSRNTAVSYHQLLTLFLLCVCSSALSFHSD
jgi:hypothetical protein